MRPRHKIGSAFAAAAAGIAVLGSAAFACTNLATMNLSSAQGKAGETVAVTGSSFGVAREGANDPVQLHWNGLDGPVLAETVPNAVGSISASFVVPESSPGTFVVVATQRNAEGEDAFGTPARATFEVVGAAGAAQPAPTATPAPLGAVETASATSGGLVALTIAVGALGLGLFAAGFVGFARQTRRKEVPAPATTSD